MACEVGFYRVIDSCLRCACEFGRDKTTLWIELKKRPTQKAQTEENYAKGGNTTTSRLIATKIIEIRGMTYDWNPTK